MLFPCSIFSFSFIRLLLLKRRKVLMIWKNYNESIRDIESYRSYGVATVKEKEVWKKSLNRKKQLAKCMRCFIMEERKNYHESHRSKYIIIVYYDRKHNELLNTEATLQRCSGKRCFENMQQIYRRTPMPKCDFSKAAKQLYCNHTLGWVFSRKFAAYFQNTFN